MPTRIETETVICMNDEEDFAQISTRQRTIKTRMRKLGMERNHKQADYECFRVPKCWVKISPPRKVSEAQRKAARERAIKGRIWENS